MKTKAFLAPVLLSLFLVPTIGRAAITTAGLSLISPNSALLANSPPLSAPYGSVSISLNDSSQIAHITFTAAEHGGVTYTFGGNAVEVNVNATSWTIANMIGDGTGTLADGGSKNVSAFGTFNQVLDNTGGATSSHTVISFDLHNTSASAWSHALNVLAANGDGFYAGAHIFAFYTTDYDANGTKASVIVTGFAADGGEQDVTVTPEPISLAIWGGISILGCAVGAYRRRKLAM